MTRSLRSINSEFMREVASELDDIPPHFLLEIQHFFSTYKDLEPGKSVEGAAWVGRLEAEAEIQRSWQRAKDAGITH